MSGETMKAGREMDALVEEKVMGGCAHRDVAGWYHEGPEGDRTLNCGQCHGRPSVPGYSTDIAAAWQVVEKLTGFDTNRDKPWWSVCVFNAQPGQIMAVVYQCQPGNRIDDARDVIAGAIASTAPLAICRAALAAVEVPA